MLFRSQLLTGVFLFGEAFSRVQAVGFGLIWAALAIYAGDGLWRTRRRGPLPAVTSVAAPAPAVETAD